MFLLSRQCVAAETTGDDTWMYWESFWVPAEDCSLLFLVRSPAAQCKPHKRLQFFAGRSSGHDRPVCGFGVS